MLQIRWNSQNCEGIRNNYVQRVNLKRAKFGELGGKGFKFGAGMLIKCCILPSRNIKSAKASGAYSWTPLGELIALPQTP